MTLILKVFMMEEMINIQVKNKKKTITHLVMVQSLLKIYMMKHITKDMSMVVMKIVMNYQT